MSKIDNILKNIINRTTATLKIPRVFFEGGVVQSGGVEVQVEPSILYYIDFNCRAIKLDAGNVTYTNDDFVIVKDIKFIDSHYLTNNTGHPGWIFEGPCLEFSKRDGIATTKLTYRDTYNNYMHLPFGDSFFELLGNCEVIYNVIE